MKKVYVISLLLIIGSLAACNKGLSEQEQFEEDIRLIKSYISENNLQAEETASGLHYIVNKEGNGNFPTATSDVTVRYRGYFLDGKTFDQSGEEGITFNLQQVIKGWTEGIPKFSEGGEGVLLIPSRLGYGQNGSGSIPGGTVLVFDVKLFQFAN
jgi:FKBP-type peptidyl-prolyl cis-trans isomerase FkpA